MKYLQGLTVLVLGLGDSGLAMARWCARFGSQVRVWDSREAPPQREALREAVPGASFSSAPLAADAIAGVQLVLKSPGLAPQDERIAPVLDAARDTALAVQGELDLFVRALQDLEAERGYAPQVLAVTGTNGKTTTTALTALLVERAGRRVASAGNIGPTMLDTLAQALDAGEPLPDVWVLELSSFQLAGARGFEPSAAVVLNVSQDHLDWHGSMVAYAAAKARIYGERSLMVINRDDPLVEAMVPSPAAVKGAKGRAAKPVARRVVRFGLDAPERPGDFGMVVDNGMAWLVRALEGDETIRRAKDEEEEIHLQRLMPADALRLRGRHNAANALAALALATGIGCPLAPMLHGLREYGGEPHRVELIASVNGIEAFDDSKGTNVGATVAALRGLGADKAPARLVVILGGDGKGQDFKPLAAPVTQHARAVALIGRDADLIRAALEGTGVPLQRHATLEEATHWCFHEARVGDAVLLSPACASLDMFRDYKHRAEVFVDEVRAIAADAGEMLL
jgi:UDP-N-acetylmuramoylalanine--D-glutamate ligase